jgi:hypothetical protein
MEGELKIQQLAQLHGLSVQVTYLPFQESQTAPPIPWALPIAAHRSTGVSKRASAHPHSGTQSTTNSSIPTDVVPAMEPTPPPLPLPKKKMTLDLSSSRSSIIMKAIGQKRQPPTPTNPTQTPSAPSPPIASEERPTKRWRVLSVPDERGIPGGGGAAQETAPPSQRQKGGPAVDESKPPPPQKQQPPRNLFLSAFGSLGKDRGKNKMPPQSSQQT